MSSIPTAALTQPVQATSGRSEQALSTPTILVVEDDADIAFTLKLRLRMGGFRAVVSRDFKAALEVARTEPIEAALLDVNIPGGDGITLIGRLRQIETLESLPTVVLTASLRPSLEDEALKAGADGYFIKPFDPAELTAKLNELVGRSQERLGLS